MLLENIHSSNFALSIVFKREVALIFHCGLKNKFMEMWNNCFKNYAKRRLHSHPALKNEDPTGFQGVRE